jgi:hypothetical protein
MNRDIFCDKNGFVSKSESVEIFLSEERVLLITRPVVWYVCYYIIFFYFFIIISICITF